MQRCHQNTPRATTTSASFALADSVSSSFTYALTSKQSSEASLCVCVSAWVIGELQSDIRIFCHSDKRICGQASRETVRSFVLHEAFVTLFWSVTECCCSACWCLSNVAAIRWWCWCSSCSSPLWASSCAVRSSCSSCIVTCFSVCSASSQCYRAACSFSSVSLLTIMSRWGLGYGNICLQAFRKLQVTLCVGGQYKTL